MRLRKSSIINYPPVRSGGFIWRLPSPEIRTSFFLDEPTAGLDVEGRLSLHEQIRQLKAMGKTIVLTSHDMAEVEDLCDRIAIFVQGKIAFVGTAQQLGETVGRHYNITIQTESRTETYESDQVGETLLALLTQYKGHGEPVIDIQINRGSLEQHFMKLAKEAE